MTSLKVVLARANLPAPLAYYARMGLDLRGKGEWRTAICPFHADRRPSMRVHTVHGGYWCPVCGAKGSMVDFHMACTGYDYRGALEDLGVRDDR